MAQMLLLDGDGARLVDGDSAALFDVGPTPVSSRVAGMQMLLLDGDGARLVDGDSAALFEFVPGRSRLAGTQIFRLPQQGGIVDAMTGKRRSVH